MEQQSDTAAGGEVGDGGTRATTSSRSLEPEKVNAMSAEHHLHEQPAIQNAVAVTENVNDDPPGYKELIAGTVPQKGVVDPPDPYAATIAPTASKPSQLSKQRRSSPLDLAVASGGVGLRYKDQVQDRAHPNSDLDAGAAERNLQNSNCQSHSGPVVDEPSLLDSTSRQDQQTRVLIQANVAETDDELRQRMFQDAVSAEVVHVESHNSQTKRILCGVLLLTLCAIAAIVTGTTVTKNNRSVSVEAQTTPSPVFLLPTLAPSSKPPADIVLQLVAATNDERNGDVLLDLFDGAIIDVDEVGTDVFAVAAQASPVVQSVEFDNGTSEKSRPFSRCGDVDRRNFTKPCPDLVSPGIYNVSVTAYPRTDREGVPWPTVSVTFELLGLLG